MAELETQTSNNGMVPNKPRTRRVMRIASLVMLVACAVLLPFAFNNSNLTMLLVILLSAGNILMLLTPNSQKRAPKAATVTPV